MYQNLIFRRLFIMLSVSELRKTCEFIEKNYGPNSNVSIKIYNGPGVNEALIAGDYALSTEWNDNGTLTITNSANEELS
jgi:hypothetical protein